MNKEKTEAMTKARVLCEVDINGVRYQPDAVVELDESGLHVYRKSVDPNPDAVAYAMNLKRRAEARRLLAEDVLQ